MKTNTKTIITTALMLVSILSMAQNNGDRATKLRLITDKMEVLYMNAWKDYDSTKYVYNSPNAGWGATNFLFDTAIGYRYYDTAWGYWYKNSFVYNNNGYMIAKKTYVDIATDEKEYSRYTYTRNSNNAVTEMVSMFLEGTTWVNGKRETTTYNTNGRPLTFIKQQWIMGAWENRERYDSSYNNSNNVDTVTFRDWYSGAWRNRTRIVYTYNAQQLAAVELEQRWVAGAWTNYYMDEKTYTPNGLLETKTRSSYVSGAWQPSGRLEYVYNSSNLLTSTYYMRFSEGMYIYYMRTVSTYNATGKPTMFKTLNHPNGGPWYTKDSTIYEYNSEDYIAYSEVNFGTVDTLKAYERKYYTYEEYDDATSINDMQILQGTSLYPNPCAQNTMLAFTNPQGGEATITVSDLNGKTIYSSTQHYASGEQNVLLDASTWATGMYIANISTPNAKANIKLVKN